MTFEKLTKIEDILENLYKKLRAKSEQRVENTKKTVQSLAAIKSGLKTQADFEVNYDLPFNEQFIIFNYLSAKPYGGNVK